MVAHVLVMDTGCRQVIDQIRATIFDIAHGTYFIMEMLFHGAQDIAPFLDGSARKARCNRAPLAIKFWWREGARIASRCEAAREISQLDRRAVGICAALSAAI